MTGQNVPDGLVAQQDPCNVFAAPMLAYHGPNIVVMDMLHFDDLPSDMRSRKEMAHTAQNMIEKDATSSLVVRVELLDVQLHMHYTLPLCQL